MRFTMCSDKNEKGKTVDTFNRYDSLLSIDYVDIITAVESNEKEYTEQAVNRVFKEILKTAMEDARHELKLNMPKILAQLGKQPIV